MSKKHPLEDRNFDDLSSRFKRNIYDSAKGQLRLAILRRDFAQWVVEPNLSVLDVGGGQGQWAIELARAGHSVLLTDPSQQMLDLARKQVQVGEPLTGDLKIYQAAIQDLAQTPQGSFDLVMCHAVLEWLADPRAAFMQLLEWVKPGGKLSLIVYNRNGLIMKNLLRTNYKKVIKQDFAGTKGSLTPLHPLTPEEIRHWLADAGLNLLCFSGMRTFHDYVLDPIDRERDPEKVIELELRYSTQEPFRSLGRYLHFLCEKTH